MARTKKFKTVAGYLRCKGDQLRYKVCGLENQDRDQRWAKVYAGQRDILNNLLPQLGLACIEATEKPDDGIRRLAQMGGTEQQVAALAACQRWLKDFFLPISSSMRVTSGSSFVGATATTRSVIFGGERFTGEEADAIEAICRERKVSFEEGIKIFRSGAGL